MPHCLRDFLPGTTFRAVELDNVTGLLLTVNECRAVVRLDRPAEEVEFTDSDGEVRHFRCRRSQRVSWAPGMLVEPIGFQTLEDDPMSKPKNESKKSTKSAAAKTKPAKANPADATKAAESKPAVAKEAKAAKKSDNGQLSALDAAAKVLGEASEPLTTKQMIEAMAAKGYWTSPGGKTPHATLYSAILRELQVKGKEARFAKTERGKFALASKKA